MAKFLNERYLLDNYEINGNSLEDFMEILDEVDDHTEYLHLNLKNMKVVSFKEKSEEDFKKDGILEGYLIDPGKAYDKGKFEAIRFDTNPYLKAGLTGEIEEVRTKNKSQLIDASSGDMYFLSANVYNTLAQRLDCDGRSLSHSSIGRDHFIADRIGCGTKSALETIMVVKHFKGAAKAFASMSRTYGESKMSILSAIIEHFSDTEALGTPTCMDYIVNHKIAKVHVKFEEYADDISETYHLKERMTPYVTLMTSSIGEGSIVAKGGWITHTGTRVPDMEYSREHRGRVIAENVVKGVKETVFDQFVSLPERMAELMCMPVTPEGCDLSTASGKAENRKVVYETFRWAFRQLAISDILGQSRVAELLELIDFSSINESKVYDAYDIVSECFKLPEQLRAYLTEEKMGEIAQKKLTKAFSKAAYLKFEDRLGIDNEEDSHNMYFTPAC